MARLRRRYRARRHRNVRERAHRVRRAPRARTPRRLDAHGAAELCSSKTSIVAEQSGRSRLLMPGVSWVRIRADNEIRPRVGSKLSLEVRGANDGIISDTSFVQTIAQGNWIWSRPSGQRFLVRGQAGTTAMNDFAELPASVRFFAGGDNSVRGYGFEELGPVDADGNVIGGSSLLTGSFEFEQPLRERWSLAFFVDSGNAFESSNVDAKTGVGIGGRWISPLGPIRIDLAVPLDDDTRGLSLPLQPGARPMKWLKRSAIALLALGLLAAAGAAAVLWVAGTESGTAWLVQRLIARAPQVTIARVRGTLLDVLVLEGVRLRTTRDELDIDSLALAVERPGAAGGPALLRRRGRRERDLSTRAGRRLERRRPTGAAVARAPRRRNRSHAVSDDRRPHACCSTRRHFAGTYGGGRLDLEQVTTTWGDAAFVADASFELRDGIDFDVTGNWSAPLAGVASNGTVTLTGTWPELRVHHELATPFAATSDGTLSFDGPFNVNLVSEWQALAWPGVDGSHERQRPAHVDRHTRRVSLRRRRRAPHPRPRRKLHGRRHRRSARARRRATRSCDPDAARRRLVARYRHREPRESHRGPRRHSERVRSRLADRGVVRPARRHDGAARGPPAPTECGARCDRSARHIARLSGDDARRRHVSRAGQCAARCPAPRLRSQLRRADGRARPREPRARRRRPSSSSSTCSCRTSVEH